MFQGIFKSAINDANKNYIFGTGSIPINIKTAQLATFVNGTTKQQGYQVLEVSKLISTMLKGWDKDGNKPKSMSDNYLELILSCDKGFVVKKRLQFPHIIAWKDDSTPYNIADVYKEFSVDNWLKADDFENPDITLVAEPTDEILTTSTATPPEATTQQSGRFYLYYRNLPVGINRVHIDFHIKAKTEPIDFDLEVADGLSWKDAQTILASNNQAKINVLLSTAKDVYKFTGAEGNFEDITLYEWSELYQQIISLNPNNKFTHDLYFYLYELGQKVYGFVAMTKGAYISTNQGVGNVCPLTQTTFKNFDCAIVDLEKGFRLNIEGFGGKVPRFWAILDKTTHKIIDVAEAESYTPDLPFKKIITTEQDCIVVVNVYGENAYPAYGNYANTPYSVYIEPLDAQYEVYYEQGGIYGASGKSVPTSSDALYTKCIRTSFIKIPKEGKTFIVDKHYSFKIYEYDESYNYIGRETTSYNKKFFNKQKGFVKLVIYNNPYGITSGNSYFPDTEVYLFNVNNAEKANLQIYNGEYNYVDDTFTPLQYTNFASKYCVGLNATNALTDKIADFENAINTLSTNCGHTVNIQNIGYDQSNSYQMKGYIITPEKYSFTMAFTAHIHGNEKYNPLGLIALFRALADKSQKDESIIWMRENVRWIGIFMCNPYGYVNNTRNQSRNVNINRNFDYNWNLQLTAPDKGSTVYSEAETQNITSFFQPYLTSIDAHCDWHDMFTSNFPYGPFYNYHTSYDCDMAIARRQLELFNNVPESQLNPYASDTGCVTNWMWEIKGIPSVTSEQSQDYWINRGFSVSECAYQAAVMSINLNIVLINFCISHKKNNKNLLFNKKGILSFRNIEFSLNTWSFSDIQNKASLLTEYNEVSEFGDVKSYIHTANGIKRQTALIVCDYNDSQNVSRLSVLGLMRELESQKDNFSCIERILKVCDLVCVPYVSSLNDISILRSTYEPDFIIMVSAIVNNDSKPNITVYDSSKLNKYLIDNYNTSVSSESEIFGIIGENGYFINCHSLGINEPDKYCYIVEKWIESIISILFVKAQN